MIPSETNAEHRSSMWYSGKGTTTN